MRADLRFSPSWTQRSHNSQAKSGLSFPAAAVPMEFRQRATPRSLVSPTHLTNAILLILAQRPIHFPEWTTSQRQRSRFKDLQSPSPELGQWLLGSCPPQWYWYQGDAYDADAGS